MAQGRTKTTNEESEHRRSFAPFFHQFRSRLQYNFAVKLTKIKRTIEQHSPEPKKKRQGAEGFQAHRPSNTLNTRNLLISHSPVLVSGHPSTHTTNKINEECRDTATHLKQPIKQQTLHAPPGSDWGACESPLHASAWMILFLCCLSLLLVNGFLCIFSQGTC